MNLEEMLAKTPEPLRPIVAKYGPALAAMTAEEFLAWLELLIFNKTDEAWAAIMARLPDAEIANKWKETATAWQAAAAKNAARLAIQKEATLAVLRVLLAAALSLVGL